MAIAVAFLILILGPAIEYAADEAIVTTPALELPSAWRAAAVPVGCALMLLVATLRLARVGGIGQIAAGARRHRGDRRGRCGSPSRC